MDYLNHTLLNFSHVDPYRAVDAVEGVFVTGSPGSGKTSTFAKGLAMSFLRSGYGGLVLTAKSEETRLWLKYIKDAGREDDLILFNVESGHSFDPLFYEWNRPGRGAADFEAIIDMFSTLMSIGKHQQGTSSDPFWTYAVEQLIRNIIVMLSFSEEPISIETIDRMIADLPVSVESVPEWEATDLFPAKVVRHVMKNVYPNASEAVQDDISIAYHFITQRWAGFDIKPRSSVEMTWAGMADKFLFSTYHRLFCAGKCSFLPEMTTHSQKLVICDFPVLEYGINTGRLINCLLKICFMRAWLRRDVEQYPVPAFLWQDEAQMFLLGGQGGASRDNAFAQVARSSRICTVFVTQNILNVAEALAEDTPGARTKSLLGNFALKVFHQQNDVDTNTYAANLLGKSKKMMVSVGGVETPHLSQTEHLMYNVEPDEFSRLGKPDTINPWAEAIVYQGGKPFKCTMRTDDPRGKSYLKGRFRR